MLELLQKGGWVIYPILAGSVIGLALFFERLWVLQQNKVNPPDIFHYLLKLLNQSKFEEARVVCQRVDTPMTRLTLTMLAAREQNPSREAIKDAVEDAGRQEAFFLERRIGALGIVASLEPLMGLLGTVLGMIEAFRQVEIGGVGDPRVVAGGVWAALVTTAVGLMIAIPAYIGFRYLLARVDRMIIELQNYTSSLLEAILFQHPNNSAGPSTPITSLPSSDPNAPKQTHSGMGSTSHVAPVMARSDQAIGDVHDIAPASTSAISGGS